MIIAVGMQKYKLILVVLLETVFIGMIGAITGILASIPILGYYYYHPIPFTGQAAEMMLEMGFDPVMFFPLDPAIFLKQALIIFIFYTDYRDLSCFEYPETRDCECITQLKTRNYAWIFILEKYLEK
jgi:hypothetical protein